MTSIFKSYSFRLGITAALLFGLTFSSNADETKPKIDRAEIEKIVHDYLLANPEILLEVQTKLQEKQQVELEATQKEYINKNRVELTSSPYQIEIGSPEAKKTIIEFFDYNCGYCVKALTDMQNVLDQNDDVRFILKEYPVLGEASQEASLVSLAFSQLMPELHGKFHVDLLSMEGVKDGKRAKNLAIEMGVKEEDLDAEMENQKAIEAIQETYEFANNLGISGTPSYIIGDMVIPGYVGLSGLTRVLSDQE